MPDATQRSTPLLHLTELADPDARLVAESVRRFTDDHVRPYVADWYERGVFPREIAGGLAELGLLGVSIEGFGCAGLDPIAAGCAYLELEAADSGLRSFASVQGALAMGAIDKFGSDDQKEQWLPQMAKGEVIGCFGLTEPDAGSDPGSMRTRARRDGTDWVIDGTKMWITNGAIADVAVVWAVTDDGVSAFLVPTETPGFQATVMHDKLSLRASVTSELILDGCRLPADAQLPDARGLGAALKCLNDARYGIAWGAVGSARECYEIAVRYATEREQFGRPIGGFQLTQRKLATMAIELQKAALLAAHVGKLKRDGQLLPAHVSMAKLNNVRTALDIAREARTILGANGVSGEYGVMRHANNLEAVLTYEGTEEIHTLVVGEAITGLQAYR